MVKSLFRAMRPAQWVKNVFVLAPIVFGLRLLDPTSLALSSLAFLGFCLVSSAVYLLNDLVDREADAQHPTKRFRPIASGALPPSAARLGLMGALFGGVGIGLTIHTSVALVLLGYFGLNVAYSLHLKHLAFIDIGCIAGGFLLRVLAGGLAIAVPVSGWLLACTFLLASLLALGKRRHELTAVFRKGRTASTRRVLDRYRLAHIDTVMALLSIVVVISYTAYTLSASTIHHFGTNRLVWTLPFVVFGIWRFRALVVDHQDAQSPTDTMVRDVPFVVNVGLYSAAITLLIYLGQ